MAPGTIVRYTKNSDGFRWSLYGIDVDPENPLEVVAPDVADLVDSDPSIPLEKYPTGDIDTDIGPVDGLDIAPNSVTADSLSTEQLSNGIVGEGETLSRLPLSDGDEVLLESAQSSGDPENTTSTTYVNAYTSVDEMPLVHTDHIDSSLGFSNIKMHFSSTLTNDTAGETTFHRSKNFPSAGELSYTGTGFDVEKYVIDMDNDYFDNRDIWRPTSEIKVSGGQGTVYRAKYAIVGVI